jgi:hypothetical protein
MSGKEFLGRAKVSKLENKQNPIFSGSQFSPRLFKTAWQTEKLFPFFVIENWRRVESANFRVAQNFQKRHKSRN